MSISERLGISIPSSFTPSDGEQRLLSRLSSLEGSSAQHCAQDVEVDGILTAGLIQNILGSPSTRRLLRGIRLTLVRAQVTGPLDLSFLALECPLTFKDCSFDADITLHHARLVHLTLEHCMLQGLSANGAVILGDLDLRSGVRLRGTLSLERARIRGSLRLNDLRVRNPLGTAVQADNLEVGGEVEMMRLRAVGRLAFHNARVRGNFILDNACLLNAGKEHAPRRVAPRPRPNGEDERGSALTGSLLRVQGSISMSGLRARGEIIVMNAQCRGNVIIADADLRNGDADALTLDGLRVRGSVFLDRTRAYGGVRIPGADVGLDLDFQDACIRGPHPASAEPKPYPPPPSPNPPEEPEALTVMRTRVHGNLHFSGLGCLGAVVLDGACVDGQVRWRRATLRLHAPAAPGASRGACSVSACGVWVQGSVELSETTCNGLLDFTEARVEGGFAATRLRLEPGITGLLLDNAVVRGEFAWVRTPSRKDRTRMVLSHSHLGRLRHGRASWPAAGELFLHGCVYRTIDFSEPSDGSAAAPPAAAPFSWGKVTRAVGQFVWGGTDRFDALCWLKLQDGNRSDAGGGSGGGVQNAAPFDPQPYEQLSTVRRNSGDDDEATRIEIEMERARNQKTSDPAARFAGGLKGALLDYGHSTRRVWVISLVLVVAGAILFGQAKRGGVLGPAQEDVFLDSAFLASGREPEGYPRFNAFIYSLDAYLPIVELHQERYWLPNAKRGCVLAGTRVTVGSCGAGFRGYLWLHIVVGWVATTLLVISVTGVMRHRPTA